MTAALVTGASARIGAEVSRRLANDGYRVSVHTRSDDIGSVVADIRMAGGSARHVTGDLQDQSWIESMITEFIATSSAPRVLVNNASMFSPDDDLDAAGRAAMMAVNVAAPLQLTRALANHGEESVVINIVDSGVGLRGTRFATYESSRRDLEAQTVRLAVELAPTIRVSAVSVGPVLPPAGLGVDYLQERADEIPLRRPGRPQDVAEAVAFLARSNFISGTILHVDGGQNAMKESRRCAS